MIEDAQPIGPEVSTRPADVPTGAVLEGRLIRLEPLDPELHADVLVDATSGLNNSALWQYLFDGPFEDRKEFYDYISKRTQSRDALFFALISKTTGRAV